MSCALTSGYTIDCKDSIGGIKEIYIAEKANVTWGTQTAGVISTLTNATGKHFWKYEQIKETSHFSETMNDNVQNGTTFYTQELEIVLNKLQTSIRNEILLIGKNRLFIVVVDSNGKNWILGYQNGMDRDGGTAGTGTAYGDRNGYSIKFKGMEQELACEFSGALSLLTTAGT